MIDHAHEFHDTSKLVAIASGCIYLCVSFLHDSNDEITPRKSFLEVAMTKAFISEQLKLKNPNFWLGMEKIFVPTSRKKQWTKVIDCSHHDVCEKTMDKGQ